jgi:hypothetical protein
VPYQIIGHKYSRPDSTTYTFLEVWIRTGALMALSDPGPEISGSETGSDLFNINSGTVMHFFTLLK